MAKKGVNKAKDDTWKVFSKYIRLRDALKTTGTQTYLACCTCGRQKPAFGVGCAQAGHFIPGRTNAILFDERGVHGQCYHCNIQMKGNWLKYEDFMLRHYGQEVVDELKFLSKQIRRFTVDELREMKTLYNIKIQDLMDGHLPDLTI